VTVTRVATPSLARTAPRRRAREGNAPCVLAPCA
jgi:hypothetical protein